MDKRLNWLWGFDICQSPPLAQLSPLLAISWPRHQWNSLRGPQSYPRSGRGDLSPLTGVRETPKARLGGT